MTTGDCLIVRGADPTASTVDEDPEIDGFEGEKRRLIALLFIVMTASWSLE
jgi:hypothetical protein